MKKTLTLIMIVLQCLCANAQKQCWIAINTNDCSVCQSSYFYIKRIDPSLNPILVLNESDSLSAEFFVREHLGLANIPYIVDNTKYETLVKDQFSLQVKLYEGKKMLKEMPVKYLAERYLELNAFATAMSFKLEDTTFNASKLDSMNRCIKQYFIGATGSFNVKNELVVYNKLSNRALCVDLKTGNCIPLKLTDSVIHQSVFGHKDDAKRYYYQSILEDRNEVEIYSYCYYKNKLYLHVSVVNYGNMKNAEELELANMEVEMAWDKYLLEYSIENSNLKLLRKYELVKENDLSNEHFGFSIYSDQPVLYFEETTRDVGEYAFFFLEKEWVKLPIKVQKSKNMSYYFSENVFYNQVVYNFMDFILINNSTGKYRKILQGKMVPSMLYSGVLYVYKDWVYFNVIHRKSQSHKLMRVNLENSKIEILQEFVEPDAYSFYPIFYHDESTQTLYVLDISDKKAMVVVGQYKL